MQKRTSPAWFLMLLVLALVAAACSGSDDGDTGEGTTDAEQTDGGGDAAAGDPDAIVSVYVGEPESLTPTNSNESNGIEVLGALFTGLMDYDPETNEPINAIAESVESEDQQTWTITLKDGWTFHNGEPVTSESFVNAWNYAAYGPNAQQNSYFFANFAGYDDLQCGTTTQPDEETGEDAEVVDCEAQPPAAEELSGLTVTSDTEFSVELTQPESFFVNRLGYPGYSPLPEVFFEDPEAFNEEPVGTGPLMMDGAWEHNQLISTVAYPDYAGDQPMQIGGVEFRIYDDVNTAVNDLLAGNLDLIDELPPDRAREVEPQVPNYEEFPDSAITYLGFPMNDEAWGGEDNAALRQALSMAIDREAITDAIFDGGNAPANNFLAPVIPGYEETVCDNWTFNPELAQQRYEESGGVEGGFTVYYNAGAGHEQWIEAAANQWAENLGIDVGTIQFEGIQPFGDYLQRLDAGEIDGPFRLGWGMDFPHPQNYLATVLGPDATPDQGGSNTTWYTSEEYGAALEEALAETDLDASLPLWQDAVGIACEDVPLVPIYYGLNQSAWNDTVSNVTTNAFGQVVYPRLTAG